MSPMLQEDVEAVGAQTPPSTGELIVPRPQPDGWRWVRMSCGRLFRDERDFVAALRHCLMEVLPALRGQAADGGLALSAYLARALVWAALARKDHALIEEVLHRVGAEIRQQGFPADGYLALEHAVLRSARLMQDADWNSPLSAAWVDYLTWFTAHLRIGGLSAPAWPAPPPVEDGALLPADLPAHPPISRASRDDAALVARPRAPRHSDLFTLLPATLGQVFMSLRERHFPIEAESLRCPAEARQLATHRADKERTLDAVCSLVAERTGADLRAPRPEQEFDHLLIERVLATLAELGHAV